MTLADKLREALKCLEEARPFCDAVALDRLDAAESILPDPEEVDTHRDQNERMRRWFHEMIGDDSIITLSECKQLLRRRVEKAEQQRDELAAALRSARREMEALYEGSSWKLYTLSSPVIDEIDKALDEEAT